MLVFSLLLSTPAVWADDEEEKKEKWYDDITVNALVSAAYGYNFNKPPSGDNQLRTFDVKDDSFAIDAELVVQKPVAEGGDAGFRVDLVAGTSIPAAEASSGLFRDPETGEAEDIDLQQALVSYVFDAGRGVRVDAGKMVTHIGYELIEGYDGFNDFYTHSFIFGYAIPFAHTGVKASYPFTDHVTGMVMVCNGWDVAEDNNGKKTFGEQLYVNYDKFTMYLNHAIGAERADDERDLRQVVDLCLTFRPTDRVTLGLNGVFGTEEDAAVEGDDAQWSGAAAYARFKLGDKVALSLRGERFEDDDGARTGTPQSLTEITVTPEVRVKNLVFRTDFRWDGSDEDVFESDEGAKDNQATVSLNLLYVF